MQRSIGLSDGAGVVDVLNRIVDGEIAVAIGEEISSDGFWEVARIDAGDGEGIEIGNSAYRKLGLVLKIESATTGGNGVEADEKCMLSGNDSDLETDGGRTGCESYGRAAVRSNLIGATRNRIGHHACGAVDVFHSSGSDISLPIECNTACDSKESSSILARIRESVLTDQRSI